MEVQATAQDYRVDAARRWRVELVALHYIRYNVNVLWVLALLWLCKIDFGGEEDRLVKGSVVHVCTMQCTYIMVYFVRSSECEVFICGVTDSTHIDRTDHYFEVSTTGWEGYLLQAGKSVCLEVI